LAGISVIIPTVVGWFLWRYQQTAAGFDAETKETFVELVPQSEISITAIPQVTNERDKRPTVTDSNAQSSPTVSPPRLGPSVSPAVVSPESMDTLLDQRNREVTVQGILMDVIPARSGRHIYLEFSKSGPPYVTRGILPVENKDQRRLKTALDPWVGKRVRIMGKVDIERFRDGDKEVSRPKIILNGPSAVQLAE